MRAALARFRYARMGHRGAARCVCDMSPRLRNLILAGGVCIAMAIAAAVTLLLRPGLIARTEPTTEIRTGDERTLFRKAPLPGPGEEPAIEPLAYPGGDYKFQEHSGPIPFEYEPPIPAHEMAELLKPVSEFGTYPSDEPETLRPENRSPKENPRSLGDLRWHGKNRTLPDLLGAIREELRPGLAKEKDWRNPLSTALRVAATVDAATARGLAWANLRLAPANGKAIEKAVNRLALALWRAGEDEALARLLEAGPSASVAARAPGAGMPATLSPLLGRQSLPDDAPMRQRFRLAVANGDPAAARSALAACPKEKRPAEAKSLVQRLADGLGAGLDEQAREKLAGHLETLARRFEDHSEPLTKRFADWPEQRILRWVRFAHGVNGGNHDAVADALLYLLEKRDFQGADLSPAVAIQAAFRVRDRGDPGRAVALFTLTQTLGYPPHPPGPTSGELHPMEIFNGFEASIYAASLLAPIDQNIENTATRDNIWRAIRQMLAYSIKHCTSPASAGIAGRSGYLLIAIRKKWHATFKVAGREAVIQNLRRVIDRPPHMAYRYWARIYLGEQLVGLERWGEAYEVYRKLALGREGGGSISFGIEKMAYCGWKAKNPKWIDQAISLGERALNDPAASGYIPDNLKDSIAKAKIYQKRVKEHRKGNSNEG